MGTDGRLGLIRNFPGLYDGTHIEHPLAERTGVPKIEFKLEAPWMSWSTAKSLAALRGTRCASPER